MRYRRGSRKRGGNEEWLDVGKRTWGGGSYTAHRSPRGFEQVGVSRSLSEGDRRPREGSVASARAWGCLSVNERMERSDWAERAG